MPIPEPIDWSQAYARVQRLSDRDVLIVLRRAYRDINRMLREMERRPVGIGNMVREEQLRTVKRSLLKAQAEIFRKMGDIIRARRLEAAARAIQLGSAIDDVLFAAAGRTDQARALKASLLTGLESSVEVAMVRMGVSAVPLAERIYRTAEWMDGRLELKINSALARGLNAREFAKEAREWFNPDVPGGTRYAAYRLARSEINNAYHAMSVANSAEKPWIDKMKWHLSRSHPKPDVCDEYARGGTKGDGVYRPQDVPRKPHPHCVIAGTVLTGPRPEAVMTRRHTGEFVKLHTLHGRNLTVTPNHPILAVDGWVAAGKLDEGSRIVCRPFVEGESLGANPYNQQMPALVEDVARTFQESALLSTGSVMRVAPEDFHGDGGGSDVAVVWPDGLLRDDSSDAKLFQHIEQFLFNSGDPGYASLSAERDLALLIEGLFASSDFVMRCDNPFGVLVGSPFGVDQGHGLAFASELDAFSLQPTLEGQSADRERKGLDDLRRGFAGPVEIDQVLSISRFESSHDVYNFQTSTGWYISNGIITHNCFCFVTPVAPDEDEFLDNLVAGRYNDYLGSKMGRSS